MCEDPLEVDLDQIKDQVLQDEVSSPDTEPGKADSTATGSESRELLSRGGSAPLQVDTDGDSEEEVTEVAAEVKTVEEKATLRTLFHRTPEGVKASQDVRGKFKYELVKLPAQAHVSETVQGGTEEEETGTERWQRSLGP